MATSRPLPGRALRDAVQNRVALAAQRGQGEGMNKQWRHCKPGMLRRVDFALSAAAVRLLATFVYSGGRVYQVEDIATGRRDVVGVEFCKIDANKPNRVRV